MYTSGITGNEIELNFEDLFEEPAPVKPAYSKGEEMAQKCRKIVSSAGIDIPAYEGFDRFGQIAITINQLICAGVLDEQARLFDFLSHESVSSCLNKRELKVLLEKEGLTIDRLVRNEVLAPSSYGEDSSSEEDLRVSLKKRDREIEKVWGLLLCKVAQNQEIKLPYEEGIRRLDEEFLSFAQESARNFGIDEDHIKQWMIDYVAGQGLEDQFMAIIKEGSSEIELAKKKAEIGSLEEALLLWIQNHCDALELDIDQIKIETLKSMAFADVYSQST